MATKASALDRLILSVAPRWGASRIRARAIAETLARHYEAASSGRRTGGWARASSDANSAAGPALATLRAHSRDLVRNNAWARNALRVISTNTVGWGIQPKALDNAKKAGALWKAWGETTDCDASGRLNFYGIQALAMRTIAESGEVLIRKRWRRPEDELSIPIQLQVLEPDYLDTTRDGMRGQQGGPIIHGVEFDAIGRRVAYWLFASHPGASNFTTPESHRVPADQILHVFREERPGQVRGVSWFAPVIVNLKDFDEYEDASLLKQKIAACFAAFVTDADGSGVAIGEQDAANALVETLEPGLVSYLTPGKDVKFASPPSSGEDGFSVRTLRRIAAGLGVTYEDLTGDYSLVNYSSGRMGWLRHWNSVEDWRWNMLVPQLCDGAWAWAMEAAWVTGLIPTQPRAEWTPPPKPMLDPDKEGLAATKRIRSGIATLPEVLREQGKDPDAHLAEIAESNKKLDDLGIILDSDPRAVTQSGQIQQQPQAEEEPPEDAMPEPKDEGEEKPEA